MGFGNVIIGDRVIAIVNPESAPLKRLKKVAKDEGNLSMQHTAEKPGRSLLRTAITSYYRAIQPETIASRFMQTFSDIEKLLEDIRESGQSFEE